MTTNRRTPKVSMPLRGWGFLISVPIVVFTICSSVGSLGTGASSIIPGLFLLFILYWAIKALYWLWFEMK